MMVRRGDSFLGDFASLSASMLMCLLGSLSLSDGPTTSVDTWSNSPKMQPGVRCKSVSGSIVSAAEKKKCLYPTLIHPNTYGTSDCKQPKKQHKKSHRFIQNLIHIYYFTYIIWRFTYDCEPYMTFTKILNIIWLDRSHSLLGCGPLEIPIKFTEIIGIQFTSFPSHDFSRLNMCQSGSIAPEPLPPGEMPPTIVGVLTTCVTCHSSGWLI